MEVIQTIFIRPKSRKICYYTINDSLDTHSMSMEDMYHFLGEKLGVTSELTQVVKTNLDRSQDFLIDFEHGKVFDLIIDYQELEATEKKRLQQKAISDKNKIDTKPKITDVMQQTKISSELIQSSILNVGEKR